MFTFLVVEDNEGDVEMVHRAFREEGDAYQILVANDGVEAMDCLHKRGQFAEAATPKLILLDLNMPRMDGKRFLEAVKNDAQFRTIPIMMFTSSQSPSDVRDCYERHASCYVTKPFDGREFMKTVREVVGFWRNYGHFAEARIFA